MKNICFLFLFICSISSAQLRNANWCFGDSAGINFTSGTPIVFLSSLDTRGSCTSISDSLGNLLFYTSSSNRDLFLSGYHQVGCVYNKNNSIMAGGDSLICHLLYQENVIIPFPGNVNLYYLFHIGVSIDYGLYYSIIDMSQNNGLGAVIQKNIQLNSLPAIDGINAVKHANGRDWWLIFRNWQASNNDYYLYLVTPDSIILNSIQSIGDTNTTNASLIQFNQTGDQIAIVSWKGLIELFDFDRCNGAISLNKVIEHESVDYPYYAGCEFSPNGRFIYVTDEIIITTGGVNNHLFQYDLTVSNPTATRDTIHTFILPESPAELKLAPDNKIYLASAYYNGINFNYPYPDSVRNYVNENLSVITSPDSLGSACNFAAFGISLGGKRTYYGLPNNPNYDMFALGGSVCDSLGLPNSVQNYSDKKARLLVNPNPAVEIMYINAQNLSGKKAEIRITNILGHLLLSKQENIFNGGYLTSTLHLEKFESGIYFISVLTERESLTKKIVKQ
jgi:hypothetical protein